MRFICIVYRLEIQRIQPVSKQLVEFTKKMEFNAVAHQRLSYILLNSSLSAFHCSGNKSKNVS